MKNLSNSSVLFCAVVLLCSSPLLGQTSSAVPAPEDGIPASLTGAQLALSDPSTGSGTTITVDAALLQQFISMLQGLFGNQGGSLSGLTSAAPSSTSSTTSKNSGSSSGSGASGSLQGFMSGFKDEPLANYPNLAVSHKFLLRCSPGLQKCKTALQGGNQAEGVSILQETINQLQAVKANNSTYTEGKQCAATRKAFDLGKQAVATMTCGVCSNFLTAVSSADGQSSPVLLDINGNGIADVTTPDYTGDHGAFVREGSVGFDVAGRGRSARTEWLKPNQDGLLVLDANGNGLVDSASELFGDVDGFVDGYAKLTLLDANHDSILTGDELSKLSIWIDKDGDGICQPGELSSVIDLGISKISVRHQNYISSFERNGKSYHSWDWFPRTQ